MCVLKITVLLDWRYLIETNLDGSGASPNQTGTTALSTLSAAADADVTLAQWKVK